MQGCHIVAPLLLYTMSLSQGMLPQDWKDADVCPIYKSGDTSQCTNYRPVSLTSGVIKILERLVDSSIRARLENNKLIGTSQFGFRKGLSCEKQLLAYPNTVTKVLDRSGKLTFFTWTCKRPLIRCPIVSLFTKWMCALD
jgi:hypothetical protein